MDPAFEEIEHDEEGRVSKIELIGPMQRMNRLISPIFQGRVARPARRLRIVGDRT